MDTLSKFGKIFISSARDPSFSDLEKLISGEVTVEKDILLHQRISQLPLSEISLLRDLSAYLIDKTLHNTLFMFEKYENFLILFDDEDVNEISDGLCGELYTKEGWIKKFSKYPSSIP